MTIYQSGIFKRKVKKFSKKEKVILDQEVKKIIKNPVHYKVKVKK